MTQQTQTKTRKWSNVYKNFLQILGVGIVTGIFAGAVVTVFNILAEKGEEISRDLYAFVRANPVFIPLLFLVLFIGAFLLCVAIRISSVAKGCGIPQAEGATRGIVRFRWFRDATTMFAASLLSIFMGLSIGAEGPSVLIGSCVGDGVASVLHRNEMIKKYQKSLSRKKYNSTRYNKTLKTLGKWIKRKNNRIKDAYHKLSHYLVKKYDLICMETLDIREMFEQTDYSKKLQNISWYKLLEMIKYKCQWYDKIFIQISQWHPSSKNCNVCGYYNKNLGDEKKWTCPHCKTQHDRDINAAKNIKQEGFRLLKEKNKMNLRDWGDSTVILLSWESTSP